MVKKIILGILLLGVFSCEYKDLSEGTSSNTCNVADPATELAWLSAEIEGLDQDTNSLRKYFYAWEGAYNNESVFVISDCCPMCNTVPSAVRNCNGDELFRMNDTKALRIIGKKIIWKPADYACTF
jgi:hypothetical protein